MSEERCAAHHICECQAKKMAHLKAENTELRKRLQKLTELSAHAADAKRFIKTVNQAIASLAEFSIYWED